MVIPNGIGVNMTSFIRLDKIKKYIKDNGLSQNKFCKLCKISPTTFAKIMQNKNNFRVKVLFKIANILQISITDLICSAPN